MVSVQKNYLNLSPYHLAKFVAKAGYKTVKFGISKAPQYLGASAASVGSLYIQYLVMKSALNTASGYVGQYHELDGGYSKVGFTDKEIVSFFKSKSSASSGNGILCTQFKSEKISDIQDLLHKIYESSNDTDAQQILTAQVISKLFVNYYSEFIYEGLEIEIPTVSSENQKVLTKYVVDKKFNLWNGVPAFALKDVESKASPLLLFRASNTVLEENDSLPTLVANFHPKGPAWKLFSNSEKGIEAWLKEQQKETGQKARVIGYSQGGILGAYFLTYHPQYFSQSEQNPSFILDAPGVSSKVGAIWDQINEKPYVHRGDLIPKIGDCFIGKAFEVRIAQKLKGFDAHRALSFASPQWKIVEIATELARKTTARIIISGMQKLASLVVYNPAKALLPCIHALKS